MAENICRVTIRGNEMGILLHNPAMTMGTTQRGIKKFVPNPEEEARKGLYWTLDKSSIGFPTRNIHSGLIQASSGMKVPGNKKMALAPIIAGDVSFVEEFASFNTKEYEIFTTRAVIQRQGILASRPRLRNWKLSFDVKWEGQFLGQGEDFTEGVLRPLLEILGSRIGVGTFRPSKKGPFGKFSIESIKII